MRSFSPCSRTSMPQRARFIKIAYNSLSSPQAYKGARTFSNGKVGSDDAPTTCRTEHFPRVLPGREGNSCINGNSHLNSLALQPNHVHRHPSNAPWMEKLLVGCDLIIVQRGSTDLGTAPPHQTSIRSRPGRSAARVCFRYQNCHSLSRPARVLRQAHQNLDDAAPPPQSPSHQGRDFNVGPKSTCGIDRMRAADLRRKGRPYQFGRVSPAQLAGHIWWIRQSLPCREMPVGRVGRARTVEGEAMRAECEIG